MSRNPFFYPFIHHGLKRQDSILSHKYPESQWSVEHGFVLERAGDKAEIERGEIGQVLRIMDY